MARRFINMGEHTFVLICGPLIFLNIAANIFYAWCLIFPRRSSQRFKQPLKTLLGVIVGFSINFWVALLVLYCVVKENQTYEIYLSSWIIGSYFAYNTMTCYVWLNFYFYTQIVPAQRTFLIWVKRNIKSVIYKALIFDVFLFLSYDIFNVVKMIQNSNWENGTWTVAHTIELDITTQVCYAVIKVYVCMCSFIMIASSFSTAHYLHRHMRSMAQSGSCFTTPVFQSQMRVTITGILQGVLYFFFYAFYLFDTLVYIFSPDFVISSWITFTVISLYISGSTVTLGLGHITFRQRAADVWKALKALSGVGMVTKDVKLQSSQSTSGEIANTVTVVSL